MSTTAKTSMRSLWYKSTITRLRKFFSRSRHRDNYDPERGQAIVRLIITPLLSVYLIMALFLSGVDYTGKAWFALAYSIYHFIMSLALLLMIGCRPGFYPRRRLFAIANDYIAMTIGLSIGGAITLPIYANALWVTVGNGLRYGAHYLIATTLATLTMLSIASFFNQYWRDNPFLVATLAITSVLVPSFVYGVLKRMESSYKQAVEANLAKTNFLAQASHDLRQPIHAISLYTALLRDAGLKQEARQLVENIDKSLQSVAGLFRSLLDISILDSGKVVMKRQAIALGELLEELIQQNTQSAAWERVSLRAVDTKLYVDADAVLLTTMIQNLISNAVKYAPGKSVLVGCRRHGKEIALTVYDQGKGISGEHIPHIFEEFYRVRERGDRDVEGVGLGLSIVKRLGKLMDLTIMVRSETGKGTAVSIEGLRIVPPPNIQASAKNKPLPVVTNGLHVLLVEDDGAVLAATVAILEKWGCIVQAETTIPTTPAKWDVLITDYDLGQNQTGSDCVRNLRRLTGRRLPAIIMTGHDEIRVRNDIDDPAIPILLKPVHPAELRSTLSTLILVEASAERDQVRP